MTATSINGRPLDPPLVFNAGDSISAQPDGKGGFVISVEKRPMSEETFTHGNYEIESEYLGHWDGTPTRFFVRDTRRNSPDTDFIVTIGSEGVNLRPNFDGDSLHFGGMSDFDELRDLITFLHGKVMEKMG